MAEFLLSAEREFGAGHLLPDDEHCQYPHGHHWRLRVTMSGVFDPIAGTSGRINELSTALDELVAEVEGKSFNDMVPQSRPTLEGVGMWVIDRLVPEFPKIVEVEVAWLDPPRRRCSIKRQPR